MATVELTEQDFEQTVTTNGIVLVDFWAEWCGPCKMIAPVLEEIAGEHADRIQIAKLNVDDNPDVARRYEVLSIPTLILFQNGELTKRLVGAKGKGQLLAELADVIG